jgi:membrane protease YdiL (CAAX protease family)
VLLVFAPVEKWRLTTGLALFEWVGLLGLTFVYARGSGRRLTDVLRLRRPSAAAAAGAILIGASASVVLSLLTQWLMPPPKELEQEMRRLLPSGEGPGALAFALLLIAVTPAICEEALFRGPILRGLRSRFSPLGAAALTGLLFGVYHLSIWRFIPTALLGFGLSAIALAADSIVPAMLAHFTYNACLVTLSRAGADHGDGGDIDPRSRLAFLAVGMVVLAAGAALTARAHRARLRDAVPGP